REEIRFLTDLDIDFDFSIIGFETAEVDIILESGENQTDDNLTDIAPRQQAISRLGEVWQAGNHRIYCGDALAAPSYEAVSNGDLAGLVITDPPFNVRISGHVGGSGEVQHREFAMASGEMSPDQFSSFLTTSMEKLAAYSRDGSLHYVFMDWRHCQEILSAGNAVYT